MTNTVAERNFSNFRLDDNVYELAGGIIPEIAESLHVDIDDEPNSEDLQAIMNVAGKMKELRENPDPGLTREEAAEFVDRSKIQLRQRRSLWTPDIELAPGSVDLMVAVTGVANWIGRTDKLLTDELPFRVPVRYLAGNRVMKLATEVTNPDMINLKEEFGIVPKESEFAASVSAPRLKAAGISTLVTPYEHGIADDMFADMFRRSPDLLEKNIGVARVANAGIIMAIQMRDAARLVQKELVEAEDISPDRPLFDSDPRNPQVFIATDHFPDVARTAEEDADPAHRQKASTALRQLVLSALKIHETQRAAGVTVEI